MQKLIKSRKTVLENKISELNKEYIFGNNSPIEKENLKKQISRYEKELMRLNNAIILKKPVDVKEQPKKLSMITRYSRKG